MQSVITANQQQAIQLYGHIMTEIKIRTAAIEANVAIGKFSPDRLMYEFCFLQLRMICELIALGCLVAHGDITRNTPLSDKEWSAGEITNKLGKLHADFYPTPVSDSLPAKPRPPNTPITQGRTLTPKTAGFLTKGDLRSLNGRSGDILHRPSLKKFLASRPPSANEFSDIGEWCKKIKNLLSHHTIVLSDNKTMIVCIMRNANDGNVQVIVAEKIQSL